MKANIIVTLRSDKAVDLGVPVISPTESWEKLKEQARKDNATVTKIQSGRLSEEKVLPGVTTLSDVQLYDYGSDESRLHLIVQATRSGCSLFSTRMEYTYFPPRSGKNCLFELTFVKWGGKDALPAECLLFFVLSFPIEYRPQAEQVAKECGYHFGISIFHLF